ncbi:MAG: TM2 domain-containing protein [Chitinophagaceae bacterium]|nr:TM2 domain-containing protein [Chitinophagaceae bacterium]
MLKTFKQKLTLTLSLGFLITATLVTTSNQTTYAAFPVEQTTTIGTNPQTITSNIASDQTQQTNEVKQLTKQSKKNLPGGKSQIIALILCIFLGAIGIHRFYLGYTWQGVVQLLTGGGCGIWALIDLIRIITGDLGPKDSSYDQTF